MVDTWSILGCAVAIGAAIGNTGLWWEVLGPLIAVSGVARRVVRPAYAISVAVFHVLNYFMFNLNFLGQ